MSAAQRKPDPSLAERLLAWFEREQRPLPWRATRDPWAVLVSEVMLQQTTVAAVTPYYERFLSRWPTAALLAACGDDELRAAWAGLGYYRRAAHLKRAAEVVAEGGMPTDRDGLLALPGVGEYTAAAVASIAYDEPVAAVDGNVERVLCRILGLAGDPRRPPLRAELRRRAQALVPRQHAGDWNQALMELGATLCRPRSPRCPECPVQQLCAAAARGDPERVPPPAVRPEWRLVTRAALLAERGGKLLLARRAHAPNQGFLELPGLDLPGHDRQDELPAALLEYLSAEHGLRPAGLTPLAGLRHVITRHRILVLPFAARSLGGRVTRPLAWADPTRPDLALTTATRRIVERQLPHLLHHHP